ncbi:unnamed protein product [Orchesella dallaii]|uniref:HRDC domain-containing protein n=1 Tax=Orchesella dallaii TaxID=48710 RepID=A0ABP1QT44_9HEXA
MPWGRGQRPHSTIQGFLEHRQKINTGTWPTIHPYADVVNKWELNSRFLQPSCILDAPEPKMVTNEEDLANLSQELEKHDVISFDTELYNYDVYYAMVCILQISTATNDYVIDCLRLFDKIKPQLGSIFVNPGKLKIVHDCQDIRYLQRDFKIFCTGVVDTQEVFGLRFPSRKQISLAKMVDHYLGLQVDKLGQLADWRVRPLPVELVKYAANDSRYLLRCWEKLKLDFVNSDSTDQNPIQYNTLDLEEFPLSRKGTLALFRPPKRDTLESIWRKYVDSLSYDLKMVFNTQLQFEMFSTIYEWRDNVAKQLDRTTKKLLHDEQLPLLCRVMPTTVIKLNDLGVNTNVAVAFCEELLNIIESYRGKLLSQQNKAPPEFMLPHQGSSTQYGQIKSYNLKELEFSESELNLVEEDSSSDSDWEITTSKNSDDKSLVHCETSTFQDMDTLISTPEVTTKQLPKRGKKKRNGVEMKVKRVFHFAQKIGVKQQHILKYIDKFPKVMYSNPSGDK